MCVTHSHEGDFLSIPGFTAGGLRIKLLCNPVFFISQTCLRCWDQTGPLRVHSAHSISQHRVRASAHLYAKTSPLQWIYLKIVPVAFQTWWVLRPLGRHFRSLSSSTAAMRLNTGLHLSLFFVFYHNIIFAVWQIWRTLMQKNKQAPNVCLTVPLSPASRTAHV